MNEDAQKLAVGKILRELDPGQFWSVLVALATIVGGSFWLGGRVPIGPGLRASVAGAALTNSAGPNSPIPCSEMPGWPKGRWWVWGRLDTPPTKKNTDNFTRIPQISPEVTFTSSREYESQTEEATPDATKRIYRLRTDQPLSPATTVHGDGSDGTGYEVKTTLTATDDGCMLNGQFGDTDGNAGTLHFLYESPRYYVLPK